MSDAPRYVTLRDYLRVLRQHRIQILLVAVLFAGAAFAYSIRQEPVYVGQASLSIQEPTRDAALAGTSQAPLRTPEQRAAESAATVADLDVFEDVKRRLDTGLSAGGLQALVTPRTETQTNFVVIEARTSDPEFSAALANETARAVVRAQNREERRRYAAAARAQRKQVEELDGEGTRIARTSLETRIVSLESLAAFAEPVQLARLATPAADPISPQPIRNTALGLLIGLTLGVILAFVRDALDRRLRTSQEIERHTGLPVIGHVSDEALGRRIVPNNGRAALSQPELEAFRILRMNLEFLDVDHPLRLIAVTSSLPEEGKTTVATSLAYTSALTGKRTVLVECDLRRPTLASRLGVASGPGLSESLASGADPVDVMQTVPVEGLSGSDASGNGMPARFPAPAEVAARRSSGRRRRFRKSKRERPDTPTAQVLPSTSETDAEAFVAADAASDAPAPANPRGFSVIVAGSPAPRPAEALGSQRFSNLLDRLEAEYDVVILDTTPLLAVVDTLELVRHVDGVLMCVRARRTTRDQVLASKAALERAPVRPTGIVTTGVKPGDELYYGHYSYAYAYGEHESA